METINNTIYFESDEEFEDFCIAPYATIIQDEIPYYTGFPSERYLQCLAEGKTFVIMDRNSEVYDRQCASKRVPLMMDGQLIQGQDRNVDLGVENLELWLDLKVPHKLRDILAQLVSDNPEITYSEVAEALDVSEDTAFMFLRNWKKENGASS